ncbi:MAG: peptide ligase PGM1-related protein, partial [Myxococcales bacterium]|nr:peptide ligase PGM1-related protein [Myxococcales bacterium]
MSTRNPAGAASFIPAEAERFGALQRTLVDRWLHIQDIDTGPKDIVIVPSLSLAGLSMARIPGITHYEERMLFALTLLRHPRAHLVYVTSQPLHPATVDYHLSLLQGIPTAHVRERLTLLSAHDGSPRPLTEKILERPRLLERIRRSIHPDQAHMTCFSVSMLEARLAIELGIPLYGVSPDRLHFGTKSGSRAAFREAGVRVAAGVEGVRDELEVAEAIAELWTQDPGLRRVVIKHEEGFSGEGNAVLSLEGLSELAPGRPLAPSRRVQGLRGALSGIRSGATYETWEKFGARLEELGGVVEAFIEGARKRSPSAQLRINPRAELECMSTHDQLLGGPDGQVYEGCIFPADAAYRLAIQEDGRKVGEVLRRGGVIGRFGVDFVGVEREEEPGRWDHYAIEINLRMSGTTHPLMMLRMLNDGAYDPATGLYRTRRGEALSYVATDTMRAESYRGLLVEDLFDIAAVHQLHYRPWTDTGVIFHMTGALSEHGKVGVTAIGASPDEARRWFEATRDCLDRETAPSAPMPP